MASVTWLNDLLETFFNPAKDSWNLNRAGSYEQRLFSSLALFEAYGWIRIGVQSGVLPREDALNAVAPVRDESLRTVLQFIENENVIGGDFVAVSRSSLLEGTFPDAFVDKNPQEFRYFPEAPTTFILWYIECRDFARSPQASNFTRELLSPRVDWDKVVSRLENEPFRPEGAEEVVSLFEGYLQSLQHLSRIASLFNEAGIEPQKRPALALMRVEVAAVHAWRLKLRDSFYRGRFEQATLAVENRLRSGALSEGVNLEAGGFVTGVEDVINRYIRSLGLLSHVVSP